MVKVNLIPLDTLKPLFTRDVDSEGLEELAQSIKFTGILQPIVVRSRDYGIIAGYRRYLAAQKAGLSEVPCVLVDCDDSEALRLCLIENLQRENLSDYELAKRLKEFKEKTGFTYEQIGQLLGKSKAWVINHVKILELENLPKVSRETLEKLSEGHARIILAQPEEVKTRLVEEVSKTIEESGEPPSVRELESKARELQPPEPETGEGPKLEQVSKVEGEEEARQRMREFLLRYAMALKDRPEPTVDAKSLFRHIQGLLDKYEIPCPVCGSRVRLYCEKCEAPKKAEANDATKFFEELFGDVPIEPGQTYECPCGCGWRITIDKATGEACWVTP